MKRPMTISEKIFAKSAGVDEVRPGQIHNSRIDLVYSMDFLGRVLFNHLQKMGVEKVFDSSKVVICFDHLVPAADVNSAEQQKYVREAVRKYGGTLYDVGRHGIMHQMVIEKGHVQPGYLAIGTDSHAPTGGAVGAVVAGVGATDAAVAMATGELWMRVPEQVKVTVVGEFQPGVTSRDLVFSLIKKKGWDGTTGDWAYKSIEFTGPTMKGMSLDARLTTSNFVSDMGAKNAIIEPNEPVLEHFRKLGIEVSPVYSDENAEYEEEIEVDVGSLPPLVACPHSPDNVVPISEVEGTRIDQVVIASCANARIEDLRLAASVLKGRSVHRGVRMLISPASQSVFAKAINEGLISTFIEAGALVSQPTCGPCYGAQMGLLASGEVCVSTTTRNMKGRMGSSEASIYLGNPAVAAAAAVAGYLTDPREFVEVQ